MAAPAPAVRLAPAEGNDLDVLVGLLDGAGLPTGDVREGPGRFFLAFDAEREGDPIGGGGFERHGDATLLRSVVVRPERRDEGFGRAVVIAVLAEATAAGAREAWLLTTTAAPFFERLGFERAPRDAAPAGVRDSHEFAGACPESAVCMVRSLDGELDGNR